jgi:putative MFS transporter
MWIIALNFVLLVQADEWGLDEASKGLYVSIIFVSFLVGPYFWTYIADRYGRMKSFKTEIYVVFLGAVGMTFSYNIGMFMAFVSLMGFALSGDQALGGTIFKEFIPASKSRVISILMVSYNVGYLISALLAIGACDLQLAGLAGWRWMCFVLLVIEAGFIWLRLNMRETPFFLASQGRFEEADEVLNIVSSRQMAITNTGHPLSDSLITRQELKSILEPTQETPKPNPQPPRTQKSRKLQLIQLFQDHLRPTLTFGAVSSRQFCILNNTAILGMYLFMPEILAGVGAKVQSCSMTFVISSVQQICCIPANILAYKLLDTRLGRRWCIVIFATASGIFMFSFLLVNDFAGVPLSQILIVSSLCVSLNTMGQSAFTTMIPEIYPTEVRSTGSGWVSSCLKVGSIGTPFMTGVLIASSGVTAVVGFYAVLMVSAGVVGLFMKETRGLKTL